MIMYAKIRRMYFREQLSINEIARRTSLSRNTIKKWLRVPEGSEPSYQRQQKPTKLTLFEDQLKQALLADSHRPKRDRRTALMLFAELQKSGYPGSYTRVTEYIRRWRNAGTDVGKSAFVPLKFRWGEAFQFDWSEEPLVVGGVYRKLQVAHIKLCASRAFLLVAYPAQSHEMLFDAHTRAFRVFGGVPLRGIYDNMKTAVDRVQQGKHRIVNARFAAMTAHYLFDPDFCNVASGWEKGIVEKNVQDSRRRIWNEVGSLRFGSFAELNAWLEIRCRKLWAELPYPDMAGLTLLDALELEQPHLMPMPGIFDGYIEVLARVSSTCLVTVQRNRYSVPCHLANRKVSIRLYPERIDVYADDVQTASHVRLFERDQVRYDWQHYIPLIGRKPGALRNGAPFADMPTPLLQLQTVLLKRTGGDRVMAELLACVPVFGLEAVLVAANMVLESGNASAEHIRNVLARLHETTAPPPLDTPQAVALMLTQTPTTDTGRYDRIRVAADSQPAEVHHD
jgi:transposase